MSSNRNAIHTQVQEEVEFIEEIQLGEPVQLPANQCVTTTQALMRSLAATTLTTVVTNPLDVFSTNFITSNMTFMETRNAVQGKLYKGFSLNFGASLARNALIFIAAPKIQNALEESGMPSIRSEMLAYGVSSVMENSLWSPIGTGLMYIRDVSRPDINSFNDVWQKVPTAQFLQSLKNNWWWGNVRNFIFWPGYIFIDKKLKHQFIDTDDHHAARCIKQFVIGGAAGVGMSLFSYPTNVITQNLTLHPNENASQLLARKFKEHGSKVAVKFLWKGLGLSSLRMFAMMGTTNLGWAIADKSYEEYIKYAQAEVDQYAKNHRK